MATKRGLVGKQLIKHDRTLASVPPGDPEKWSDEQKLEELYKCSLGPHYFVNSYCKILNDRTRKWVPFELYPVQMHLLDVAWKEQYTIILKTRQVGASTLFAAYYLWLMLFEDNVHNLMLSRGEREAQALLVWRFKPMLNKLPSWMQPETLPSDSKSEVSFSTGALLMSLPTSGGDSYTVRAAMLDEAALMHRSKTPLAQVLLNIQPTADAGGQLALVSKAEKTKPKSTFNSIFQEALKGNNAFYPVFCPWYSVPRRDVAWYNRQVRFSKSIDGTLDHVHESYPATWEEAISPKTLDKRLNFESVQRCYVEPEITYDSAVVRGLAIFVPPDTIDKYTLYIVTADPAEGNPQSDFSEAHVYNWVTGEQVAVFRGRYEIDTFSEYIAEISRIFHQAPMFVERNNHGHAVISNLLKSSGVGRVLSGPDATASRAKYGWLTNPKSKAIGYVELAKRIQDQDMVFHDHETYRQLTILEGSTLSAPKGEYDDAAICAMLYAAARRYVHLDVLIGFV